MSTYAHGIEVGDKVEILIGAGDQAKYGMTDAMRKAKGEVAKVKEVSPKRVDVYHPWVGHVAYHPSELRKVEPERIQEFKRGDRVKIVSQGAYGTNSRMDEGLGGYGEVILAEYPGTHCREARIRVFLDHGLGDHTYDHHELRSVGVLQCRNPDLTVPDGIIPEKHIQSHDELVAENESLEKQIRKLEARVERKKKFQRKNVQKIAAWQVILGE